MRREITEFVQAILEGVHALRVMNVEAGFECKSRNDGYGYINKPHGRVFGEAVPTTGFTAFSFA